MQRQLIEFLSQLGDEALGGGVQQQLQLKEESKHTTYYWKSYQCSISAVFYESSSDFLTCLSCLALL